MTLRDRKRGTRRNRYTCRIPWVKSKGDYYGKEQTKEKVASENENAIHTAGAGNGIFPVRRAGYGKYSR
jgi:hypothetical protein